MAIYKCKMCSGDLEVTEGKTVIECDFCGTKQTVPTAKDENLQGLFNRANVLRIKCEFDKAEQIYEKIIQANEKEAEAYWGLILCKYGIEYVEDPTTFKRIPTCHRTSFDSIIADDNYKSAIEYADGVQRGIYESEAKEIDRIQKDILALSQKEDPYDVFICYKETDEGGQRTQDSVIANDIYYQLTQEGFKVFYAAITLEDKLGSAYEPCIFAALNSAKVMLSIGTKPEYFNAVWVKNEWSRYLKIMKKDRSKMLIPCYKEMDAYELPEEFAHLQAQDMSKIGFINDLVRGIKKVLVKNEPKKEEKATVISDGSANVAPLLKRAFMFLEDGNWQEANTYCEKVLDQDPENARAYVGKLMAELKVRKQEDLVNCAEPFDGNLLYQKAVRYADETFKYVLIGYITSIKERNLNAIYDKAFSTMNAATTEEDYKKASTIFESISEWKDAKDKSHECLEKAEIVRKDALYDLCMKVFNGIVADTNKNWQAAHDGLKSLSRWKDADEKAEEARKNAIYYNAIEIFSDKNSASISSAIKKMKSIPGWKDSDLKVKEYEEAYAETLKNEKEENERIAKFGDLKNEYNKKYSSLISSKGEKEKELKEVESQLSKESKFSGNIFVGYGIIACSLSGLLLLIGDGEYIGILIANFVFGLIGLCIGIAENIRHKKKMSSLEKAKQMITDEILNIQSIPSLEKYIEEKDADLCYLLKSNYSRKTGSNKNHTSAHNFKNTDIEAIYWQACQAMDSARSILDISWAKTEFASILSYKDSKQRYAKCEEMIEKNTFENK